MPRILLVEDDPTVRLLWEHVLIDADYDVDTAGTVAAACDCLRRRGYDLVLTDGRLADGDGMAVADTAGQKASPALLSPDMRSACGRKAMTSRSTTCC